jgi:ABC-type multidrug transport system ATPase subunit
VEENLKFFASVFGTTFEENYELIKDIYIQIEPFKTRRAGKLSGGMKQKLALCCALIHKPEILFLDEPTTGVDAVSRKEFWETLKRLQQKDITIVVSTPYMDEAGLCDRIALIQNGNILGIDTPENIVKTFDRPLLAVKAQNTHELIVALRKFPHMHSVYPFGEFLHYTDRRKSFSNDEIGTYLSVQNVKEVEMKQIEPNIEDCFMSLMESHNNG